MKIYAFQYCPNIHESGWISVSLHENRKGAELALEFHRKKKQEEYQQFYDYCKQDDLNYKYEFGIFEDWCITEMEVLK